MLDIAAMPRTHTSKPLKLLFLLYDIFAKIFVYFLGEQKIGLQIFFLAFAL